MSIDPTAQMENVEASLYKYLYDSLVTAEGLSVVWPGVRADTSGYAEWVEVRRPAVTRRDYHRQIGGGQEGATARLMLDIACFVKSPGDADAYQITTLRDKVAYYLSINTKIDLNDYADDSSNVGTLRVEEIITDSQIIPSPAEKNVEMWVYSVALSYLEKF